MNARTVWASVGVGLALVATAVVVATAPDSDDITAVFPVRGTIGDVLEARELIVEATDIRLADRLEVGYADAGTTTTDGVWVVLDATITPRLETTSLSNATLVIDGIQYQVSGILPRSVNFLSYGAGIPQHGSLVFELPTVALAAPGAANAEIYFNYSFQPQLDSIPVVTVDLTALEVEPRAVIAAPYVTDAE